MPIVRSLMTSLKGRYGNKKGERIYYAMEAEASGPFAPGAKHHDKHKAWAARTGVMPITKGKPKKKAPRPKTRGQKRRG